MVRMAGRTRQSGAIVRKECNEHNNMKAFSLKYEAEIKSRGRKAD